MSRMTQQKEIDSDKDYTTAEAAEFIGLTPRHIRRLVDNGLFEGAYQQSPVTGSPLRIPGSAIITFLEARKK